MSVTFDAVCAFAHLPGRPGADPCGEGGATVFGNKLVFCPPGKCAANSSTQNTKPEASVTEEALSPFGRTYSRIVDSGVKPWAPGSSSPEARAWVDLDGTSLGPTYVCEDM